MLKSVLSKDGTDFFSGNGQIFNVRQTLLRVKRYTP